MIQTIKEVSCRTTHAILQRVEDRGFLPESITRAVPYTLSHLKNKNERIEWSTFCRIMLNLRSVWNDKDFEALGSDVVRSISFRPMLVVARLMIGAPDLYLWLNKNSSGPGAQLFTCIRASTEILSDRRLNVTLSLSPGHQYCREFFLITKGALTAAPGLIGLDPSQITLHEIPNGARFEITCAEERGAVVAIRKAISWPFVVRVAAREVKEANEALHERYLQLESARRDLELQAKQLKVAYVISQLAHGNLDLDSTLDAIARSLVSVAGFTGARIDLHAAVDGRTIIRTASAGGSLENGPVLHRPVESRGAQIGEVRLGLKPGDDPKSAEALLDYVIPTIAMQIDDALAFTLVNDYRNSLEQKVQERTEELHQANEALRRAQTGRDRLFANISHELRTPLTLILGPLDSLLSKSRSGRAREQLGMMKKSGDRLLRLIGQLLELARLQSGDVSMHIARTELCGFLRGIAMSYRSLAESRWIRLSFQSSVRTLNVDLDRDKAEMLFNNVLVNAFKYTPDGGKIEVRLDRPDGMAEVTVTDTGMGIPETDLTRIFDRFYQGEANGKNHIGGTGIGLSLAKELAELHHGNIRVASKVGVGSEFVISLPIADGGLPATASDIAFEEVGVDEASPGVESLPAVRRAPGKQVVLVVDDDPDVRRYLRDVFAGELQVLEASGGEEGIRRARKILPDLIVCDVMMPGMDGNEACRILKEDLLTSHIPVILLTARAGSENKIEGLENGADDYVVKPFVAKELLTRTRNLIDLRESLRQRFISLGRLEKSDGIPGDRVFLDRVKDVVDRHIGDESFDLEEFGKEVGLSRAQLHRKLVAMTGCAPGAFLRRLRLERGYALLEADPTRTVSEVAYDVGFCDASHFARCFRRQYGVSPRSVVPALDSCRTS